MRDKLDWHASAARKAGQPEEHGFVHIACFLHWLGTRGWLEPRLFSTADRARIADGSIDLDDLIDLTDEQLVGAMATGEGRRFGEARYDAYLERWGDAFTSLPAYGVPWNLDSRSRSLEILDELHAVWLAEGQPRGADERIDGLAVHEHPEVEHLLPVRVGELDLEISSFLVEGELGGSLRAAGIDPSETAWVLGLHASDRPSPRSVRVDLVVAPRASDPALDAWMAASAWCRLARAAPARFGGVTVMSGRYGDQLVAQWRRGAVVARVSVRSASRLGPATEAVDVTLAGPVDVRRAPSRPAPAPLPFTPIEQPHVEPDLESLLPAEVMAAPTSRMSDRLDGWYQQYRGPIAGAGFDPRRSHLAWATGAEGIVLQVVAVPGASAAHLAPIAEQLTDVPPGAKRSTRWVGDREVTWLKGRGWVTAVWVRDGMACSVGGHASDELLLEAISQMP